VKKILLGLIAFSCLVSAEEFIATSSLSDSVDLSNYQEIKKHETKIIFDKNSSSENGIYNYKYSPSTEKKLKKTNVFIDGNFDKIHRYDSLYFKDNTLVRDSNETFKEILEQIHTYTDNKSREIVVSIIGFTQEIENKNQERKLESGYTDFFQTIAQRDNLDPKVAGDKAINSMKIVYEKFLDNNISKDILYRENRAGKSALYTEEFSDARVLNNRVDVAIYVQGNLDLDTDKDGISDSKDYCPQTPLGSYIDKNGCPLVLSLDLKFDFDKAIISEKDSISDIQKLSNFMKKYPVYHANIIGHTDSKGDSKYNKQLSIKRAKAVKNIIISNGIKSSRLSFEGRGESEPLFENINPFNRHKNRRTEVELTLPKQKSMRIKSRPRSRGFND